MSLRFYYAPMSTASITTLVLEELGVECERIKLDLRAGDSRKPEFLKVNPNGKVPVLVHDGSVIWESAAITMYLGELFGVEKKLYPAPGPKRGEAMKWIVWTNATVYAAVVRYTHHTQDWVPADQRNAKAGEAAKAEIAACLRILDEALASDQRQFLLGEYTLADTHLNSLLDWMRQLKLDFQPYAKLNAWSERCSQRPAYKRAMALEMS